MGPYARIPINQNTCQTHQCYYVSIKILKKKSLNSSGVHALGNFEGLLIKNWHEPIIFYNVPKNVELRNWSIEEYKTTHLKKTALIWDIIWLLSVFFSFPPLFSTIEAYTWTKLGWSWIHEEIDGFSIIFIEDNNRF